MFTRPKLSSELHLTIESELCLIFTLSSEVCFVISSEFRCFTDADESWLSALGLLSKLILLKLSLNNNVEIKIYFKISFKICIQIHNSFLNSYGSYWLKEFVAFEGGDSSTMGSNIIISPFNEILGLSLTAASSSCKTNYILLHDQTYKYWKKMF